MSCLFVFFLVSLLYCIYNVAYFYRSAVNKSCSYCISGRPNVAGDIFPVSPAALTPTLYAPITA